MHRINTHSFLLKWVPWFTRWCRPRLCIAPIIVLALLTGNAGAAITWVGVTAGVSAKTTVATLTAPSPPTGITTNDVMLLVLSASGATFTAITPPAGWVQINLTSGVAHSQAIFYKIASATEAGPYTFTWTYTGAPGGNDRAIIYMTAYRGVDTTTPIDAASGQYNTPASPSVVAPSISPTVANTQLVGFFGFSNNVGGGTLPASMGNAYSQTTGGGTGGSTVLSGDEALATTGATGIRTATFGSSAVGVGHLIALRPFVVLNYIRLEHTGSGLTCTPSSVTVKACADAACTTLYTGGTTTVTLAPASGWASNPITFTGSTTASLSVITPSTVTLGTTAASPTPSGSSPQCFVGATATCSLVFADTGFILSSIPTQIAGTTSSSVTIQAVKKSDSSAACTGLFTGNVAINMASQCIDPTTCAGKQVTINATAIANNPASGISSYTPVTLSFGASSTASFTLNYPDVGAMNLSARYLLGGSTYMTGTSNTFVVKPFGFTVTGIKRTSDSFANPAAADATGTAFIKGGSSFTATVTATANGGAAAPNYGREITPEGVLLTSNIVLPAGGNNPTLANGTLAGGSFSSGVATPTTLFWNEVGIITLTPSVADASYLGAGNVTGTTTGNIGRFYPDHFAFSSGSITTRTDISPACSPASAFTYMAEPFQAGFTLTAKGPSPGNVTLLNYVSSGTPATNFAKLATATPIPAAFGMAYLDGITNLSSRVDSSLGISGTWTSGVLTATATLGFNRAATPDGPYDTMKVGIAPVDTDGVSLSIFDMDVTAPVGNEHTQVGQTQIRFGRLRLSNAHGSEKLDLPIPIQVQYWSGTLFATHTLDSCTTLTSANVSLTKSPSTLPTSITPATISFASGIGSMKLIKPLVTGSVDLCVDLGSDPVGGTVCSATLAGKTYLQGKWAPGTAWNNDPKARATFGVYKNANEFIYLREVY
jgi:MSHA biogenesis protein MshQ